MQRFWQRADDALMSDEDRLAAAMRLIRVATGATNYGELPEWVTDAGIGYTGGTSAGAGMTDVWVTGNWNDRTVTDRIGRRITDKTPARLFDALERLGVNGEWLDEYERCADCRKLIRTQPDSYGWTPQYVTFDDSGAYGDYSAGDTVCADCLADNADTVIADQYANRADSAITWLTEDQLTDLGWRDAMPDNADAATGWHPGQSDTPADIVAAWRLTRADDGAGAEYVFLITHKGQFDIHYRLFIRDVEPEERPEVPAGAYDDVADGVYNDDGQPYPFGRCDECGQPDGLDHEC